MRKNRPGSAKSAMGQQEAAFRRAAPGKQFIGGDSARQSKAARQAERRKVERMAEVDSATRTAEELGTPISAILAELVQDTTRLARTLVLAPFRIAQAFVRRPRTA
ncbi:translation initiation factor IF-2 [Anaeromyxobacter sp. SG66]|uniref:translation initiation factor IF-2 n=1 Tax=Anaeromyxobacter sp. SG66 TaxID=2925410 RepID=UPI001F567F56|nr:translation initiation factor IF-2 [Anaeromyxobacter sp. SG66]